MNKGEYSEQLGHSAHTQRYSVWGYECSLSLSPHLYRLTLMAHNLNHDWQVLIHLCCAWIVVHFVFNENALYWLEVLSLNFSLNLEVLSSWDPMQLEPKGLALSRDQGSFDHLNKLGELSTNQRIWLIKVNFDQHNQWEWGISWIIYTTNLMN